ncbi:MAG TPA: ABC transporter ATP-binding protein [Oscillospiraceae bacterium]|nr:ABC transporter ATP-binding protein [Oscillospiraceae bacterium]
MDTEYAVSMKNITKTFGPVVANEKVSLDIRKGEILSLLGENGSGKTTLMNMLSGIYYPDSGEIFVNGEEVAIRSPKDALRYGIGMVHQHFKLINVFTAAENIVLGLRSKGDLNRNAVAEDIRKICDKYGFEIDPNKKIYDMSVSEKQTVEIVKVLYRGADILILDEPTAVLTPQETERLFNVMRNMKADGKAVIIITHKLMEVLAVSDRVAVLRRGKNVGILNTAETGIQELTDLMVGHKVDLNITRSPRGKLTKRLSIRDLCCTDISGIPKLCDVSMDVFGGEILGIAGISGCGQKELLEGIAGLQRVSGSIMYTAPDAEEPVEIVGKSPLEIMRSGIALSFVPEDRLGMGLVGNMDLTDNMMIRSYLNGSSPLLDRKSPKDLAKRVVNELEVVTPGLSTPVRQLSGGNVQKVLVGREISSSPAVLMSAYAVRGLDINTSYTIYNLMNEQKERGVAVIYVGEDLDVLLELCDRIAVLCSGHLNKIFEAAETSKDEVGFYMTCLDPEAAGKEDKTI